MKKFLVGLVSVLAVVCIAQVLTTNAACNPAALGGTGTCTVPSAGQTLIGNGSSSYTPALLTPGTDIVITNASGSVTIAVNANAFLPSSTVYVATLNGQSGAVTITSSTLGVATNTISLFNGSNFTTTTIAAVLKALSATGLLTYNSSTGAFGYTSSSLALGSASQRNASDFLGSSTVYVTSVNGQSGSVTGLLAVSSTANVTASSVQAGIIDTGSQVINVKAYGAKCDGVTDDRQAFQNAINASQGLATVLFCSGKILLSSQLYVSSFEHFVGRGASTTFFLQNNSTGDGNVFETTSTGLQDFSMTGFTIDANGANQSTGTAAVYVTGQNAILGGPGGLDISYVNVKNCYAHCFFVTGDSTSTHYQVSLDHDTAINFGVGVIGYGFYEDYAPSLIFAYDTAISTNGDDAIELGHLGATAQHDTIFGGSLQFPNANNSDIEDNTVTSGTIQNDANEADYVTIKNNTVSSTPATGYAAISVFGNYGIITNNHAKAATGSVYRFYNGNFDTIEFNDADCESTSTGAANGLYDQLASNISVVGNQVANCAVAINSVFDYNLIALNTVTSSTIAFELTSSTLSGHVMVGTQLLFNIVTTSTQIAFQPNNQTGYTYVAASGTTIVYGTPVAFASANYPQTTVSYPGTTPCTVGETVNGFYVIASCPVGIGTATPSSKLDVAGGVAVGSYAGVTAAPSNGFITSGPAGFGTAQPSTTLQVATGSPRFGVPGKPLCEEGYDSVNSTTLEYLYTASNVLTSTTTKPAFCQ